MKKDAKYSVIKNDKQYSRYCDILEKLDFSGDKSEEIEEGCYKLVKMISRPFK